VHPLVSVITPAYNSSKYILDTIRSVREQTYQNWEMLIVDDASSDNTFELASDIKDPRIIVLQIKKNSGVAVARNTALQHASGRFIAYLDSDDLWLHDKLEKQVGFMLDHNIGFSCVSYEVIDDIGKPLGKCVYMKEKLDYRGYLLNNLIQTVGVMIELEIIDRQYLVMPTFLEIQGSEDAVTWRQILKNDHICYGMQQVLARYRRASKSLSSNKFRAVMRYWHVTRNIEKLPFFFACRCFVRYAFLAVWKRFYRKSK
jgi:teichuronic acid biosynthesis glycosyltransferase TuaG